MSDYTDNSNDRPYSNIHSPLLNITDKKTSHDYEYWIKSYNFSCSKPSSKL